MEDDKVPAGDEPTETSSDNLNARVTIEVNGHSEETEPVVTDEEEEDE